MERAIISRAGSFTDFMTPETVLHFNIFMIFVFVCLCCFTAQSTVPGQASQLLYKQFFMIFGFLHRNVKTCTKRYIFTFDTYFCFSDTFLDEE